MGFGLFSLNIGIYHLLTIIAHEKFSGFALVFKTLSEVRKIVG